jgi:hypothetical protein
MITKLLFKQYLTVTPTFGSPMDIEVASEDITEYLIEDDYPIDGRLEFDGVYDFIASSIDLNFIPNNIFDLYFNQAPISPFTNNYFYGIEVYLDYKDIPDFWGYVLPSSVERDDDGDSWSLTITDFLVRYREFWSKTQLPQLSNGATIGNATLNDFFTEILSNTLVQDIEVKIGDLSNFFALYIYNTYLVNDTNYFITNFIDEIQKHFGVFYFIDGTKKLRVVNRNVFLSDNSKVIDESIIEPVFQMADMREYEGILISDFYDGEDPDQPPNSGDGLYVVTNDGGNSVTVKQVLPYGGDDSEIDLFLRKYPQGVLDLSQRWNDYGVQGEWYVRWWVAVFVRDTFQQRFDSYKNILSYAKILKCKTIGYDYELMERVKYQDKSYLVRAVKKNTLSETAELEMIEEI